MCKAKLITKYKKAYVGVHGTKCKDLMLEDWSTKQLRKGINTLNFLLSKI